MPTPFLDWLADKVRSKTLDTSVDVDRVDASWLDRMTPFQDEVLVHPAQFRLAELEQLLADHARSEGRKPSGSVKQQVEALIERLDEQDKQSI